jgi:TPR repeat protein
MHDLPSSPMMESAPLAEATLAVPVEPRRCVSCVASLSGIPSTARFCPHCGKRIPAAPPPADEPAVLHSWLFGLPVHESSSQIVQGYAKALYKLGRRYEMGRGTAKIPTEALRCYTKSARLGNLMAFARLAARMIDPPTR